MSKTRPKELGLGDIIILYPYRIRGHSRGLQKEYTIMIDEGIHTLLQSVQTSMVVILIQMSMTCRKIDLLQLLDDVLYEEGALM